MSRSIRDDGWSIVLPVKDEVDYLRLSLPSAIRLNPDEIILVLDEGETLITPVAKEIVERLNYHGLRILYVARNPAWRFHQGYVRRQGYLASKHEKIFTFDADTILSPRVMIGRDMVGTDGITFVTFRKKLAVVGFVQTFRSLVYDARRRIPQRRILSASKVRQPFIGIYWLFLPYYVDLIREEVVSKIYNGEDTLAQQLIEEHAYYKHIHLDNVLGCVSLRHENEDTSWRQEQLGIYLGCTDHFSTNPLAKGLNFFKVFLYVATKLYPHVLRGFFMGRNYPRELAEKIGKHTYADMIMYSKRNEGVWHYAFP